MLLLLATTSLLIILIVWLKHLNRDYELTSLTRKIKTVDGSSLKNSVAIGCGFWGNSYDLISMNLEQMFDYSRTFAKRYGRSYIQYFFSCPVYNIIDPVNAELILNDNRILTKGIVYSFLHPFLKTGLLTSTDKKWHSRRRLLTPAFHFNILTQFIEIFKRESLKFIDNLNDKLTDGRTDAEISLSELIPRFTLNNICETALGVSLDDHLGGDDYRQNITEVEESLMERIKNPIMVYDLLYYTFGDGKNYLKSMDKLHKFSSDIIEKRRIQMEKEIQEQSNSETAENNDNMYRKQRYAMLDTMLRAEKDGLIDHAGICEEVDTFMFEGFDTTSMNLIFTLMNLALYPEMQQKCFEEIQQQISADELKDLAMSELSNLKYLECFIKETQRLYPSVPIIIRECTTDLSLKNNLLLPKGTQVNIHIFDIHRNPLYYDKPEEFRPERFMSSEMEKRHPFAFIPFSAGQRNCIGQKFAMLEMKTLLVHVLKNFKLEAVTHPNSFQFSAGILIRTRTNIKIKIKRRQ
ncbi:probable cytochrome P450 4p3 [Lucilia sericata]|uniref:probable cytochrome P450 4p3 n=1 Tax=Lucilia sericata TaxID=13632 RepID=UPI0018A87723|nr:probable cytochrome P450 4p3 [Lucilia sericata]